MNKNQKINVPEEYKPISAWGYIGYEILFSIPIVGLIAILIYSFGGNNNINLKNFAKSFLYVYIIIIAFCLLVVLLSLLGFAIVDFK